MAGIYDKQKKSIYDKGLPADTGLPDNIAAPKAAVTVLASGPNSTETVDKYKTTFKELTFNHISSLEQDATAAAKDEYNATRADTAIEVATSDMNVDDKVPMVEGILESEYEPDLYKEMVINQAAQYEPYSQEGNDVHGDRVAEALFTGIGRQMLQDSELRSSVEAMRDELILSITPRGDMVELFPELIESLVPFTIQNMYYSVAKDLFPDDVSLLESSVAPGETMKWLREKFVAMDSEELDFYLPLFQESLANSAGLFSDNGFLAMQMVNEVFSEQLFLRQEGDFDWDRFWNNVVGAADSAIILGPIARLVSKFRGSAIGKTQGILDNLNPEDARRLRAAILQSDNADDLTALTGLTREGAATDLYPTFRGAINSNVPGGIVDEIANLQVNLRKVEEDVAFGINYTQEELIAAQSRVREAFDEMEGVVNHSFSELRFVEDEGAGFTVRAAIGPNKDVGFRSIDEATDHFKANFGEGTPVDFMVREGENVVDFNPARHSPDSEVWYRVEQRHNYNMSMMDDSTLLFGGPVLDKGFLTSNFIKDPASRFNRFLNKVGIRAHDFGQGLQGRMTSMVEGSFKGLNNNSKLRVIDALEEGGRLERNFTVDELVGKGFTSDEILSYYGVRGVMDLEYSLNNMRVYNTLRRDGYQSVVNDQTGHEFFARPIAQADVPDNIRVFDPDANVIVPMRQADIDTLYASGGQVHRSRTIIEAGEEAVSFVATGLGNNTRVRPLNLSPMSYRPGYVTRFYDENYFVKMRKSQTVDGVRSERWVTVAASPTKVDGSRLMDTLTRQNPNAQFRVDIDQRMAENARFDTEFDYLHRTGGIITGRRGEMLKGINEATAETKDFIESVTRSISYTANRVSHDDAIASLERRWVNTYGRDFGLDSIPDDLRAIRGATPSDPKLREAKAVAEYIQAMKGTQSAQGERWKSFMIGVAESMENMMGGGRTAMHIGDYVRNFNPISSTRGITFNLLLASNPMRQLLLQANQASIMAGVNPKYVLGGGLPRDFTAFTSAAATRNRPQWGAVRKSGAKVMGISEKQFEQLYDGFVRSGLPQSIDSHTFARDGLIRLSQKISSSMPGRIGTAASNMVKAPMLMAKKVGFDAGEWSNLAMSFLVSYKEFQKRNPGRNFTTKGALDDIATDARDYALNMTKTGELPYQKGILSLATQFLSFQHKTLLVLAGKNKLYAQLPNYKKFNIALGQFFLYGADGLGIGASIDKLRDRHGWDIPDQALPFLDGLVYEYALNGVINALSDDNATNLNVTAALAPGSGVLASFEGIIANLSQQRAADFALGASASAIGRVADAAYMVHTTLFEIPDLSNAERLQAVLQQGGQIFGGYNNYVKGQAMRNIGYQVSNSGVPLFKTTFAEGWATSLFGIGSDSQDDFFRIQQEMNGPYAPGSVLDKIKPINQNDISDIAETYYDRVLKVYREMSYSTPNQTRDDLWRTTLEGRIALENTLFAVLPPDVAFAVRREVQERIGRNLNSTGVDDMISYMARGILGGRETGTVQQQYLNMLQNSNFQYTPEQMQDIEALINHLTDTTGLEQN